MDMNCSFLINLMSFDSLDTAFLSIPANKLLLAKIDTVSTLSIYNFYKLFPTESIYASEVILVVTFGSQSMKTSNVVLYIAVLCMSIWPTGY